MTSATRYICPTSPSKTCSFYTPAPDGSVKTYGESLLQTKNIIFLSPFSLNRIGTYDNTGALVLSEKATPMADYYVSYARLCSTNGWKIEGRSFLPWQSRNVLF